MKQFTGLYSIHLELTSLCNKNCWMCGRRKVDREYPDIKMNYGHMDFNLLKSIAKQVPAGINIQMHNSGEPLLYPQLGEAIQLFDKQFTQFDTNAKLLVEKADEIIGNLDAITISVIQNDPDADEQYENVVKFLEMKQDWKPMVIYRILGDPSKYYENDVYKCNMNRLWRWEKLPGIIAKRTLHDPMGSRNYRKPATVPETGVCVEVLTHLAINKDGLVSLCVRFDPNKEGVIGDLNKEKLIDIWNSPKRLEWVKLHRQGKRNEIPLCSKCHFWGIPTG